MTTTLAYERKTTVSGIRSRFIDNGNGLDVHFLEAGPADSATAAPTVLLLHGFPELAYSWRRVMPRLAEAGFHVIAPDQRGYGQTTGWEDDYDADLRAFHFLNLVRDVVGLLHALDIPRVAAVVGHNFGASIAAYCALLRPDRFQRMALMSAPFSGPPGLLKDSRTAPGEVAKIADELAGLTPPRKHYHAYYATREANHDMQYAPQGVHAFLRAYFHQKSADWPKNRPFELSSWTGPELAQLPRYYVMDQQADMAATVASQMPSADDIARCMWLPDHELEIYSTEFQRTGFQGGLNWYRARLEPQFNRELQTFAGRRVDVPACFIAGRGDWGAHQSPGALSAMQSTACSRFIGSYFIDGAGHWVQQEQSEPVARYLLKLLDHT